MCKYLDDLEKKVKLALAMYKENRNKEKFVEEIGVCIYHCLGVSGKIEEDIAKECYQIMRCR